MENISFPAIVLAIGIIVVIMGIAILAKLAKLQSAVSDADNRPAGSSASTAAANPMNDGALIAAISAAIAVYTGGKSVAIKSVRRVTNKGSVWAQAGRRDQMY